MWTPNGSSYSKTTCTLTTSWQRFALPFTAQSANNYLQIGVDLRDGTQTSKAAQTIYAWGAQLELGLVSSAYTPTTTAAVTTTNNINVPSGQVLAQSGTSSLPSYSFAAQPSIGLYTTNTGYLNVKATYLITSGTIESGNNLGVSNSTGCIYWGSSGQAYLYSDSANTLAQRNSANAQAFRTYLTYTDSSNYSRYAINTTANYYQQASESAGTGALKPVLTTWFSSASAPTATNIPAGNFTVWKNTTDGTVKLYANDGGTLKSIVLI